MLTLATPGIQAKDKPGDRNKVKWTLSATAILGTEESVLWHPFFLSNNMCLFLKKMPI